MSGRAEIAAGCPESPKALCLAILSWAFTAFLWSKTVLQHELYVCTQLPRSVLYVPVSAWWAKAQGCGNNSSSYGKGMIHLSSGWQWPLCQSTSWPIQDLSFTRSRTGIHLMAKSGFSGTALVNTNKELWCSCNLGERLWSEIRLMELVQLWELLKKMKFKLKPRSRSSAFFLWKSRWNRR